MPSHTARHQHRHFKTLILLVVSMTGGAFLLYWIDQHTPTHRPRTLRGLTAPASWTDVAVRTAAAGPSSGFFHFRIDSDGQWFQSSAWKNGVHEPQSAGTIHIVLTPGESNKAVSQAQQTALRHLVDQLRREYQIDGEHVRALRTDDARVDASTDAHHRA